MPRSQSIEWIRPTLQDQRLIITGPDLEAVAPYVLQVLPVARSLDEFISFAISRNSGWSFFSLSPRPDDGQGEDRRWTLRGVIDCLAQITRNRVAVNGAEFDQNSTSTPEQDRILELLQVAM